MFLTFQEPPAELPALDFAVAPLASIREGRAAS